MPRSDNHRLVVADDAPPPLPTSIDDVMSGSPYVSYLYSYPHKMTYRPLPQPQSLGSLWADQDRSALFLYVHIPFCEMRCGFCNLFTTPRPNADPVQEYVAALERQAEAVGTELGSIKFSRMAIGGGTPTYLDPDQLDRVFDVAASLGADLQNIPISVETSPETGSSERLAVLAARGVDRVSMGVQSFIDSEVRSIGRAQKRAEVESTIATIRQHNFATLNLDLMYGLPDQTEQTWQESLGAAIDFNAEEIYLYPLYVRPLTGMGRRQRTWDDERLAFYRSGRERLLAAGYQQASMRMFRRVGIEDAKPNAPLYSCQADGMLGLGVGARSYTDQTHYSSEYAVANSSVKSIIADYIDAPSDHHRHIHYGIELTEDDKKRRFVILSLLATEGLDRRAYHDRFHTEVERDFPQLAQLCQHGAAKQIDESIYLTPAGLQRSDAIGPWLHSPLVNQLIDSYQQK